MEMLGTLKSNHLPDSLTMWYEMDGVLNIVTQKHQKISEYKTLVVNQQEFQFYGIMKIIGFFKPTGFNTEAFKTQTRIYLNAFKDFVENSLYRQDFNDFEIPENIYLVRLIFIKSL